MKTLTSKDNAQIKNILKLQKSAKFRRQSGCFIAEGLRVCVDAVLSGAEIQALFITDEAIEKNADAYNTLSSHSDETYVLSSALFDYISDTQAPQGILCVIKTLDKSAYFDKINNGGKYLVLDNVQDPNNLGTILRSAEAFGVCGVIMSDDCCDIYNPKVVRGSMGAVFRLAILSVKNLSEWFAEHPALNTYAAVVDRDAVKVNETVFEVPCAVVIGNEGNGIRPETCVVCDHKITIPMDGKAESLNASAAAAILIWEMVK